MKYRLAMLLLLAVALVLSYLVFGNESTTPQSNPTTSDPGIKLQQ